MSEIVHAVTDPFDVRAKGAQWPDAFAFPTDTKAFHQTFTVTCDSNGNAQAIIFPNPSISIVSNCAVTGGFSIQNNNPASFTAGVASKAGLTKRDKLVTDFTDYRLTGFGAKVRCLSAMTTVQGRIQVASVPSARYLPGLATQVYNKLSLGDYVTYVCGQADINAGSISGTSGQNVLNGSSNNLSQIIQYADSVEVGSASTLAQPLVLKGKITSPRCMDWRCPKYLVNFSGTNLENSADPNYLHTGTNSLVCDGFIDGPFHLRTCTLGTSTTPEKIAIANVSQTGAPNTWSQYITPDCVIDSPCGLDIAGGLTQHAGDNRIPYIWDRAEECGGWNCYLLNFVGCGASTVMEIDFVMHIEGIPNIIAGAGAFEGSAASYQPFSPGAVNKVISANAHTSSIR